MIRVAVIGSGFGLYGLLPAFLKTKGCKVVAICGSQTPRLTSYCKKIGLTKIYSSWQELLISEKVDAIAIAVPPDAQYEIAKEAIKKGIHVFAEKPLAATLLQAAAMVRLARKQGVTTAVDFIFPEIEEWKIVKKIVEKKKYGKLVHLNASWDFHSYDLKNKLTTWKTDEERGGGALAFFGSHLLHNIRFFVGDYKVTSGNLAYSKESKNGGNVGFDTLFSATEGVTGQLHLRCNEKNKQIHSYTFIFEKAILKLESQQAVTSAFSINLETLHTSQKVLSKPKRSVLVDQDERVHEVLQLTSRFINACRQKKQMNPSFEDGLFVQKLIQKILKQAV